MDRVINAYLFMLETGRKVMMEAGDEEGANEIIMIDKQTLEHIVHCCAKNVRKKTFKK